MKDKGKEGDTECSADIPEHVSQPDDRAHLLRHQLYTGVVSNGKHHASTEPAQEEQE